MSASAVVTSPKSLRERRRRLVDRFAGPALFSAGHRRARNYAANTYPFRAESHFLYFAGASLPGAMLLLHGGTSTLFVEVGEDEDAIWHGEVEGLSSIASRTGVDSVAPLSALRPALAHAGDVATLPGNDEETAAFATQLLGREIRPRSGARLSGIDAHLAEAVIATRLVHDEAAVEQMSYAASVTTRAHAAITKTLAPGVSEARVRAAIEAEFTAANMQPAYGSIVSVHGEVLHHERSENVCEAGDLLLVDAGAESEEGWASDVTRVYPVSGRFSDSQRAIYDVVLAANRDVIGAIRPGVEWRSLHRLASRTIVEGLVALGILRGSVDGLLERNAGGVFFPHGLGHLLGLDVHDMEDLGDRAGYAPGRVRIPGLGERYLRLDRVLVEGMGVTVEPGFYRIPAILRDERYVGPLGDDLDRAKLAKFSDVRGIRLEDDIIVTADGAKVLTADIPIRADDVERAMTH